MSALPVYTILTVNALPARICGSGEFGFFNKINNRRFFAFNAATDGTYVIAAIAADANSDPMFSITKVGQKISFLSDAGATDEVVDDYGQGGDEFGIASLTAGVYVGEVMDYAHVMDQSTTATRCFDIAVLKQ